MLHIERDEDGTPTENGSATIKQALKQFWSVHGRDAVLSQPLQLVAAQSPLEHEEAIGEFEMYGAS
jgi:hypothetical protein